MFLSPRAPGALGRRSPAPGALGSRFGGRQRSSGELREGVNRGRGRLWLRRGCCRSNKETRGALNVSRLLNKFVCFI